MKYDDNGNIPTEQSTDLNEPKSTSPTKDQSNYEQVERVAIEEEKK